MRKKRIFLSFLLLVLSVILAACHSSTSHSDTTSMGEAGTWSIYLYLCGSNLETKMGAAGKNLDEILTAAIPSNVNVIIETGGAATWRSHDISEDSLNRYVVKDGKLSLLETLPQGNMGEEKTFATSAKNAQKFGCTTADEGYSNLIDLIHFAGNIAGVKSAKDLTTALKAAVLYQVRGAQKSNSGGLSFYYPSYVEKDKLKTYCKEICPSSMYCDYLKQVYENIPKNPITFTDCGSKAKDGFFQIQLDQQSKNYILSIDYILVEYEKTKKKGNVKIDATWLGQDNDMSSDKEGLTCYSNFRGVWLNLNGRELFAKPVEDTTEYIIFASPILLNGEKTNLRFVYIWDDSNPNGDYYQIIGA